MSFVRIEFSGITLSPDNELNVLTMNGVGRGTQMDHIQTHRGDDDCFEWFGGTVDLKFGVASGCLDDLLDSQLGYRGRVQHALAIQELTGLDTGDRHAFEWDNNETVQGATPFSEPRMCNVTAVGTRNQGGAAGGKQGARHPARHGGRHLEHDHQRLRDRSGSTSATTPPPARTSTPTIRRHARRSRR